jgi:hypothetical protein
MIFYSTSGNATVPAMFDQGIRRGATVEVQEAPLQNDPPENALPSIEGFQGELTATESPVQDVTENFEWGNPKTEREFIKLEQKKLAKKATPEEVKRYLSMKRDRNANIFADRNVRDYAEVQRLKKLSEKLEEIQKYMRPFPL